MDSQAVATVRAFNRIVTQRIGALDDHYLARDRPLGESRLLWEIGPEGCDVRALRTRLGLDSGYLSRLLRSLEAAGLVSVGAGDDDRRVRRARLTPAGRAEHALLDRRSDDLARALLAPLGDAQRRRLVTAMGEVERLLTATLVEIAPVDVGDPRARYCLQAYFTELQERFPDGYDPGANPVGDPAGMRPPGGLFLLATLGDEPVGCGGLKFHPGDCAELKRLWVSPSARGLGLGRRLLGELERRAAEHGARSVRLDSNRTLTEAIALYRGTGYREVPPFNGDPYADHWFEKPLAPGDAAPGQTVGAGGASA